MELERHDSVNDLLDLYGPLLTKRQQEIMQMYYREDCTLTEISDLARVSRQAVYDAVRKSEQLLFEFEQKLRFSSLLAEKDLLIARLSGLSPLKDSKNGGSDIDGI